MTGVDPAFVEKPASFLLEAFGIGEDAPVHAEETSRLVINDEGFVRFFHDSSSVYEWESILFPCGIPGPVLRDRTGIDAKVDPGNHPGIIRGEKNYCTSIV